jgi:hypothetical protein
MIAPGGPIVIIGMWRLWLALKDQWELMKDCWGPERSPMSSPFNADIALDRGRVPGSASSWSSIDAGRRQSLQSR